MKKTVLVLTLVLCAACLLAGCAGKETAAAPEASAEATAPPLPEPSPDAEPRSSREIIEDLAVYYGRYGEGAREHVKTYLHELAEVDPDAGARWREVMELWRSADSLTIHNDVLPDGLPDTDELCITALGFQLEKDGSMKEELVERLKVVLASAEKYPNAYVLCTGGGTAEEDDTVTEAGKMAEWLEENGVDKKRLIVEDKSVTTAQNAMFSYDILTDRYPQVKQLVIVSSDYHIATGTLLFGAEAILRAPEPGKPLLKVVSNAAYKAPKGTLSTMFQAGALIELAGDEETVFMIYYDTYDIHELPKEYKWGKS